MSKINSNRNVDDILFSPGFYLDTNISLNGKDMMILMKIVQKASICSLENPHTGQIINKTIDIELVKEGCKQSSVTYTINKLIKYNVIKDCDTYYQINPNLIWIPSNPDNPTSADRMAFSILKNQYDKK